MKKVILTIVTALLTVVGFTQFSVTTEVKTICEWSSETEAYDANCLIDKNYSSMFTFNEAETLFKHTTSEISSTYYVTGTNHVLEDDRQLYVYYATSDVGNKYMFFFDQKFKEVRAIPIQEGDMWMAVWFIKSIFR